MDMKNENTSKTELELITAYAQMAFFTLHVGCSRVCSRIGMGAL